MSRELDSPPRDLPTDPGLCGSCRHLRLVASSRSTFVRCGLADTDRRYSRYPPLPVLRCAGYEAESAEAPSD